MFVSLCGARTSGEDVWYLGGDGFVGGVGDLCARGVCFVFAYDDTEEEDHAKLWP